MSLQSKFGLMVSVVTLSLPITSIAQTELEILAGPNFSAFSPDPGISGIEGLTTFAGGVGVFRGLAPRFSVGARAMFETKGWETDFIVPNPFDPSNSFAFKISTVNSYLSVPILARYSLLPDNKLNLETGPSVGIHLSAKTKLEASTLPGVSVSTTDQYSSFSLSWAFGLSASFPISDKVSIRPALLYNLGLTDILKSDSLDYDAKYNTFNAQLGVAVKLGSGSIQTGSRVSRKRSHWALWQPRKRWNRQGELLRYGIG